MDLSKAKLPPVYGRNGRKCYLDPVRQKLIYVTPEETVRQKVISCLLSELKVPAGMLAAEEPLARYGVRTKDRADIVIRAPAKDGGLAPLAVIECKAETVPLDEKAFQQAQRYSDALGCTYTALLNGIRCFCFKFEEETNRHIQIKTLPAYADMLAGDYIEEPAEELPPRVPFEELEGELTLAFEEARKNRYVGDISPYTSMRLALPLFNLWDGLLDVRVKMPAGDYGLFRLVEDYGVRMLSCGNGSGGHFFGPYRSFLVEVDGNTEFYSLCVASYWKSGWNLEEKPPKTCVCVAHDDEKTSHHALQLVAEDNAAVAGNTVRFYHHGRIAVGRIGSGKKAKLRELAAKRYPKAIDGDRYYLGSVTNDHLLRLDEPDVVDLVVNLISYSIVRDEYRRIVKDGAGGKQPRGRDKQRTEDNPWKGKFYF